MADKSLKTAKLQGGFSFNDSNEPTQFNAYLNNIPITPPDNPVNGNVYFAPLTKELFIRVEGQWVRVQTEESIVQYDYVIGDTSNLVSWNESNQTLSISDPNYYVTVAIVTLNGTVLRPDDNYEIGGGGNHIEFKDLDITTGDVITVSGVNDTDAGGSGLSSFNVPAWDAETTYVRNDIVELNDILYRWDSDSESLNDYPIEHAAIQKITYPNTGYPYNINITTGSVTDVSLAGDNSSAQYTIDPGSLGLPIQPTNANEFYIDTVGVLHAFHEVTFDYDSEEGSVTITHPRNAPLVLAPNATPIEQDSPPGTYIPADWDSNGFHLSGDGSIFSGEIVRAISNGLKVELIRPGSTEPHPKWIPITKHGYGLELDDGGLLTVDTEIIADTDWVKDQIIENKGIEEFDFDTSYTKNDQVRYEHGIWIWDTDTDSTPGLAPINDTETQRVYVFAPDSDVVKENPKGIISISVYDPDSDMYKHAGNVSVDTDTDDIYQTFRGDVRSTIRYADGINSNQLSFNVNVDAIIVTWDTDDFVPDDYGEGFYTSNNLPRLGILIEAADDSEDSANIRNLFSIELDRKGHYAVEGINKWQNVAVDRDWVNHQNYANGDVFEWFPAHPGGAEVQIGNFNYFPNIIRHRFQHSVRYDKIDGTTIFVIEQDRLLVNGTTDVLENASQVLYDATTNQIPFEIMDTEKLADTDWVRENFAERVAVPSTDTDSGTLGQFAVGPSHLYFYSSNNKWGRITMDTDW